MADRPILRFPDPTPFTRKTGKPRTPPRPHGPGKTIQSHRFQRTFERLDGALNTDEPEVVLRQDPAGIAPERALVFITAGNIQNFARAASDIGLEVFAETELEEVLAFPEGFIPPDKEKALSRTLYATMPTLAVFEQILSLWKAYQNGESKPRGAAPWWNAFDLLLEIRPWGPEDRLTESAREVIEDRLPLDDNKETTLEIELWPTINQAKRASWRKETEDRIAGLGGGIVDRSIIEEIGFTYDAILARMPVHAVRTMLDAPASAGGLATLEGVQFILPQTIGQAVPDDKESDTGEGESEGNFDVAAPIRVALLDGTPVAGHAALDGGVVIEDVHDLVRLSTVDQRYHATAMASLILRGDLESDGKPLQDTRLVSIPLLVDSDSGPWSPGDKLFVDLVHSALVHLLTGDEALSTDVFVVNFSIGVPDNRFAGRISALARLMDWWSVKEGVLFVISAGNIGDPIILSGISASAFEDADENEQRGIVRTAMRELSHGRTLLSPAEALNSVTVGAISRDLNGYTAPDVSGIIRLEGPDGQTPQITSARGLGLHRSIKPDILEIGGSQEVRAFPQGQNTRLHYVEPSQRTGLIVAAPRGGMQGTLKSRGTSAATAMATRAILQSAEVLVGENGPYEGQELPRWTYALLTRALAVNAARWPDDARDLYEEENHLLGPHQHVRAKEEVCRHFGHGVIAPELMRHSPENGVTLVGFGSIRKDQAQIFRMPLPASMSGDRVPRSMRTTIAWFSPVNPARAQYRLASLEAVIADDVDEEEDKGWSLALKSDGPDANMVKRGSVWSRRMVNKKLTVPDFGEDGELPIRVQCRDTSNGGLNQDEDITFALAVTLQVEADVQYDVFDEVETKIRLRLQPGAH
ncbi:S8 family peptidase [Candidatus Thiodiazotropha sp. CDECU1]|uniref:S8 family peptidase n=1 Tax=Candidatus Thiodiazotropha sp. CDECU1 TaxID=3065865 RepID=UPI00292F926F|nr:S8 family peptidase [Candidatus Thiodiazotropha sp. CDECU1]